MVPEIPSQSSYELLSDESLRVGLEILTDALYSLQEMQAAVRAGRAAVMNVLQERTTNGLGQ